MPASAPGVRRADEVVLAALGDAPVLPADDGAVGGDGLDDDRRIGRPFEIGQGIERDGDRRGRVMVAGLDAFDGQIAVPMLRT